MIKQKNASINHNKNDVSYSNENDNNDNAIVKNYINMSMIYIKRIMIARTGQKMNLI